MEPEPDKFLPIPKTQRARWLSPRASLPNPDGMTACDAEGLTIASRIRAALLSCRTDHCGEGPSSRFVALAAESVGSLRI